MKEKEERLSCPNCKSLNVKLGYGLAGGGIGAYKYCWSCSHIWDKIQDDEGFNYDRAELSDKPKPKSKPRTDA